MLAADRLAGESEAMESKSVALMRDAIKRVYPSKKWQQNVDKMGPNQVLAVYLKLRQEGKIQ